MVTVDKIVDEINNIGNINPVDFSELEAAFQSIGKVTEATAVSAKQAGTALKTVIDRINSVKTYEEEHYLTIYGNQSKEFKTIYGEMK